MKDFSFNDIENASREAFRMQSDSKFSEEEKKARKCSCRFEKRDENCPLNQNGKSHNLQKNSSFLEDDKLLILVLVLVLSKNSSDKLLMAALLYIIM